MELISGLISGSGAWIAAVFAGLVALALSYFGGKKVGKVQTQAKADVKKAESKTEEVKAAAKHETEVVNNANKAKSDTANLNDNELRERMRDKWTDK